MVRSENYNTFQSKIILEYIKTLGGRHFSAEEIVAKLKEKGVARATVYRRLDKLFKQNLLTKHIKENGKGCCYSYSECKTEHYHVQCISCGKTLHLECEEAEQKLSQLAAHIEEKHSIKLDTSMISLYGCCSNCEKLKTKEKV